MYTILFSILLLESHLNSIPTDPPIIALGQVSSSIPWFDSPSNSMPNGPYILAPHTMASYNSHSTPHSHLTSHLHENPTSNSSILPSQHDVDVELASTFTLIANVLPNDSHDTLSSFGPSPIHALLLIHN